MMRAEVLQCYVHSAIVHMIRWSNHVRTEAGRWSGEEGNVFTADTGSPVMSG